ncbi:uncharacterized protein LOC129618861 [Condylostylus longicornis]|uniref:uncharacterized protein LOC129618861 n=1 Tax=Condylostylus longicornis TaxID=2530218 RepID=UPI00244E3545|nr:uncharacterized protein LOC129618861 [Condylostylus longicornis]
MNTRIEVCHDCKDKIKNLIKSPGYKPLANPKACEKCKLKTVEKSYHAICNHCAVKEHICAKCMEIIKDDECIPSPIVTSDKEHQKFKKEIDKLIKTLPERKRNKFLRFMRRGKKVKTKIILPATIKESASEKSLENLSGQQQNEQNDFKDYKSSISPKKLVAAENLAATSENNSEQQLKTFVVRRVPHSKETLLRKIEELRRIEEVDETETDETESEYE